MSRVSVLVVEDEIIIADNICDALTDIGYQALEPAISYTEALNTINLQEPDIAILDINLSGEKSGIDLGNIIKDNYKFPFVFLTSNSDKLTVLEAKKAMPSAFLIKPFTKEELFTSIEIALFNFAEKYGRLNDESLIVKNAIFIKDKEVISKISFNEILYIKSAHVYVEIILTLNRRHVIRGGLNMLLEKLSDKFIRIHRGYIVNFDFIKQIDGSTILIEKKSIPIGKKYKENLLQKLNIV